MVYLLLYHTEKVMKRQNVRGEAGRKKRRIDESEEDKYVRGREGFAIKHKTRCATLE